MPRVARKKSRQMLKPGRIYDPRSMSDFEQYVRLRADIVQVIGRYVDLKKKGGHYVGQCPFHPCGVEKELAVYPKPQLFACWSAGCSGGSVFDFIAKVNGVDREEAVRILAQEAGISADLFHITPPAIARVEPRISFSMLKLFEQCPRRYHYRYIEKKRDQKTTSYLALGRIVHKVLAEFFRTGADSRSLDVLLDTVDTNWKNEWFPDVQEADEYRILATDMVTAYFRSHDCHASVWRVEAPIKCSVGGFTVTGVVDRIDELADGTYELIDYKTEPKDPTERNSIQLALYYYGVSQSYTVPVSKLTLEYLPSQEAVSVSVAKPELDEYIATARDVIRQIQETEHFRPKQNLYCADCVLAAGCPQSGIGASKRIDATREE